MEILKNRIEEERKKLDALAENGLLDATYRQSLVVDRLIEQYLDICNG
ncbi:MAG: Spo0E family sporulation regulatory protein-aspartic acid phosphatase [Eubacteriales bacterium]|nr:Spo0E family sporulation regulatory protein-aspartic acid phosphatase [Eubacteriales bacterium]